MTRRRLDAAQALKVCSPQAAAMWPTGFRPLTSIAYFLRPIPLKDYIDARQDLRNDKRHELLRDLSSDCFFWCRLSFVDFVTNVVQSDDKKRRLLKKVTARDRLCRLTDVTELFSLVRPPSYCFSSYADGQMLALSKVALCKNAGEMVHATTVAEVRNIVSVEFECFNERRALHYASKEQLLYTNEFVSSFLTYLRSRFDMLDTESKKRPIMVCFSSGRLGWFLNESQLLPVPVVSVNVPTHGKKHVPSLNSKPTEVRLHLTPELLLDGDGAGYLSKSFSVRFPVQEGSIVDQLYEHEPSIVIVEPHQDRDWLTELRGFYSVREVIVLGPLDSPAMGSFSFPWLSFGVSPGPQSFWTFNDYFHKVLPPMPVTGSRATAALGNGDPLGGGMNTFMDPPYVAQGYSRHFVDDLSPLLVHANDCNELPFNARMLSFRRHDAPLKPKKVQQFQNDTPHQSS